MGNASATTWRPTSPLTPSRRNPKGDFTAIYVDTPAGIFSGRLTSIDQVAHITEGRLSLMPDRASVIIYGTIAAVRVFEDSRPYMPPSAMVRVESNTGGATYVRVSGLHYDRIWGYLVMGRSYGFSGKVVRPEPAAPEYVELARLLTVGADEATPETYAAQQNATPLTAVSA